MFNLPLFDKVLDKIKTEPETWDQSSWAYRTSCGTAFCFAGHVVSMTMPDNAYFNFGIGVETDAVVIDGRRLSIRDVAQHELGLDETDASALFSGGNTLETIEYIRELLISKYAAK